MLTLLAALAAVTTAPALKTFDVTTFRVPGGFEFTESPDHVNFRRVDPTNWILFGIYASRGATADLSAEFTADWNDLLSATQVAVPAPVARTVGSGIVAREGGVLTSIGYVQLIDVAAGSKVVSIIIESGNAEGFTTYRKTIDAVLASLVVQGTAPVSTAAAPAPLAAGPAPAVATQLIHEADLVGVWDHGSSTNTTYRQLAAGTYAGAASHFFATEYSLTADGKYTSRFWATHPVVSSKGSGTWGIQNGFFVIFENNEMNHYQIASFGPQADGRTKLALVKAGNAITEFTQTDDWYRAGSLENPTK